MPAPPQLTLKVIVISHLVLTIWASMIGDFLPISYTYMNAFILAVGMWGVVCPESSEALLMFIILNLISILMDIIFLGIFEPTAKAIHETGKNPNVGVYRFSLGMCIVNLLIKPLTTFVLYKLYQDRGGQYGDLGIPGLPHFGGGSQEGANERGYENIDSQVESASPHDFKGQPASHAP